MNANFNDELLSAYLDGQLIGEELAAVEAELADNAQARALLEELRSLSREIRELPRQTAGPEFADRVVRAALGAKAVENNGQGQVERPAAAASKDAFSPSKARRGRRLSVVLAGAAAVAAAVAMMAWPWLGGGGGPGPGTITTIPGPGTLPGPSPEIVSAAEAALSQLRQAVPKEGEAVVIRLRLGADGTAAQVLDQALTAAGIGQRPPSDQTTGAMQYAAEYRRQLADKFGGAEPGVPNTALMDGTIAAADAVFIEASWESLEKAFGTLASGQTLAVCPLSHLAATLPGGVDTADGEGEGGSKTNRVAAAAANYAQRLPAGVLRLDKAAEQLANSATIAAAPLDPQRRVRVLILVEPAQ
jgi:hypothetical protein